MIVDAAAEHENDRQQQRDLNQQMEAIGKDAGDGKNLARDGDLLDERGVFQQRGGAR